MAINPRQALTFIEMIGIASIILATLMIAYIVFFV